MADDFFAYLFEAKGIGRYISASGKLRDMIGASELVAQLTSGDDSLVCQAAQSLNFEITSQDDVEKDLAFSRRAGGAFCVHSKSKETLQQFADLFRLVAMSTRPGLEMSDAWGKGHSHKSALKDAYESIPGIRENSVASMVPIGGPMSHFSKQTGLPVTKIMSFRGSGNVEDTFEADFLTLPHRHMSNKLNKTNDSVGQRFLGTHKPSDGDSYIFPRNLEDAPDSPETEDNPLFPFLDGDRRLAMVHADLSGLGQIFRNATEKLNSPLEIMQVSEAIEQCIEESVQAATGILCAAAKTYRDGSKTYVIPARPILLGGDDITIIVRADLALPFTAKLLEELRNRTEIHLANLQTKLGKLGFPTFLSACAGVAVVRPGQPFQFSLSLAEDLCNEAKKTAKLGLITEFPGAIAFHVATTTLLERYSDIRDNDLTAAEGLRLTANPYFVTNSPAGAATWEALSGLAAALANLPGARALLNLRDLLFRDEKLAAYEWSEWRRKHQRRHVEQMCSLDKALRNAGIRNPKELPFDKNATMLFDALELIDIGTVASTSLETAA